MKKGIYIQLAGCIGLGWALAIPGLAEPSLHAELFAYSPDRWPSRWSAIVRQNQPLDRQAYGYGNYERRPVRHENPWAHDSSALFEVPAGHRPWGEPPRKSRRQQVRASRYREQQRPEYRQNNLYNQYNNYLGTQPQAYPGMGFGYMPPLDNLGGPGLLNPYGMPPMLGAPLLGGYPYPAYPVGMGGMGWPYGAW